MKLDLLLSQFLYQHKKLVLPGIGTFILDPASPIPDGTDKQNTTVAGITFDNKSVPQIDDNLIDFVRTHTGKIKPLAISDIDSYINLSVQLLNIGNPLHIEGIGTLMKARDGRLNFTPGHYMATRLEDMTVQKEVGEQESFHDEGYLRREPKSNSARKILIIAAALITLGVIGGGAYYLYQSNVQNKSVVSETENVANSVRTDTTTGQGSAYVPDSNLVAKDSALAKRKMDSSASFTFARPDAGGNASVKYVLETTANKSRALKRYSQLKSYGNDIRLDVASDSSSFKLYFVIPSTYADTARIKDSLTRYFQNRVRIE